VHNALPAEIALFPEKSLWYSPLPLAGMAPRAEEYHGGIGPMRKEALWGLAAVGVIWLVATPARLSAG
jgi:hypothetical protein